MDLPSIVRRWAYIDPIVAYWLARAPMPRDYKVEITLSDGTANKAVGSDIPAKLWCDYFVCEIEYTVWEPNNTFRGNVLGPLYDVTTAMKPGLQASILVNACERILITDGLEPIELAMNSPFNPNPTCREFPVPHGAGLHFDVALRDTIPVEFLPIVVTIVVKGVLMPCRSWNQVTKDQACYLLAHEYGVDVPRSAAALERIGGALAGLPEPRELIRP